MSLLIHISSISFAEFTLNSYVVVKYSKKMTDVVLYTENTYLNEDVKIRKSMSCTT